MSKSESIINLSKALFKFQSAVTSISKDSENPFFKSRYASLHHILGKIDPILSESGLVILQFPIGSSDSSLVTLDTTLLHAETGEFIQSGYSMVPVKKDPQSFGSCITYMRRYALVSILKLNIDDNDDDANEVSLSKNSGLTRKPEVKRQDENKVDDKLSEERYKDLANRITLSQSKDELAKIAIEIRAADLSETHKINLRELYISATENVE